MTLGEAQRLFASRIPRLIDRIYDQGYECTFGDAFRDPRVHGELGEDAENAYGRPKSLHKLRLAIDLNLFRGGAYLRDTEAYRPFGEYWVGLDPENHIWGGDFKDGNHFSFTYWGLK